MADAQMVSIKQAAEFYGVARGTIERWVKQGYIPYQRFGRTIRIRLDQPEGYIAAELNGDGNESFLPQRPTPAPKPVRPRSGRRVRTTATQQKRKGGRR